MLAALAGADVRFVVVGGVAVVLHGHPRLTADLDLAIDLGVGPVGRAMQVLTGLGLVSRLPVPASAFADPATRDRWVEERNLMVFTLTDPDGGLLEVDLFARSPLPFEALWSHAVTVLVGETEARIASIEDLITMKREAGLPHDLADVAALESNHSVTSSGPTDPDPDEGLPTDLGFEAARAAQVAHWATTTPAQRLAWLAEAQRFAHQAGALPPSRPAADLESWNEPDEPTPEAL